MKDEGIIVFTNLKQNWDGIQGVDLVHVEFTEHLPARLKPATRKIPPAILEVAKMNSTVSVPIFSFLLHLP